MTFRIIGLEPARFQPLFDLDDVALARLNARRVIAEAPHAAPCRVSLLDAEPGEEMLLLNYEHQAAASPFRACGPIFVRRAATRAYDSVEPSQALQRRVLSARAYDADYMMVEGELVDGREVAPLLERWLSQDRIVYAHLHYASRGCFAAGVIRA